jgi:hypothetical protein
MCLPRLFQCAPELLLLTETRADDAHRFRQLRIKFAPHSRLSLRRHPLKVRRPALSQHL